MNFQPVGAGTLTAAKNQITALQEVVRINQLSIQNQQNAHYARRQAAKGRNMYPSEFAALFPTALVDADFVAENTEIAAKQAALATAIAQQPGPKFTSDQFVGMAAGNYRSLNVTPLERRIEELKTIKKIKIDGYSRNLIRPERALTDAEFLQLYLAPNAFTLEAAAISAAMTECNALNDFFKSGPYPSSGQYDISLLAGTAVAYP